VTNTPGARQQPLNKQLYNGQYLCKQWLLLSNCCNNHACSNGSTEEQCFLHDLSDAIMMNGVSWQFIPRSHKQEDLLDRASACEEAAFLNGIEIH
jgi:hypothetical protein